MARARRIWAVSSLMVGKCSHSSRVDGVGRFNFVMVHSFFVVGVWVSSIERGNKVTSLKMTQCNLNFVEASRYQSINDGDVIIRARESSNSSCIGSLCK